MLLTCKIESKIISYDQNGTENVTELPVFNNVNIGSMPIMVSSNYCALNNQANKTRSDMGECEYDEGGYFIVKGSEKVVVSFERKCENKIFVFPIRKGSSSTYSYLSEITSVHQTKSIVKNIQVKLTAKDTNIYGKSIKVQINKVKADIPSLLSLGHSVLYPIKILSRLLYQKLITNQNLKNYLTYCVPQ